MYKKYLTGKYCYDHSAKDPTDADFKRLYTEVRSGWIPLYGNGRIWSYAALRSLGGHSI